MREVNLEEGRPSVADAIGIAEGVISLLNKNEVAVFIHGYGSSGKGGKIRVELRKFLNMQERTKKVTSVVLGEEFEMFNPKAREVKSKDDELIKYYNTTNCGVTIVQK